MRAYQWLDRVSFEWSEEMFPFPDTKLRILEDFVTTKPISQSTQVSYHLEVVNV